jgi:hypothetical protein
MKMKVTIAMKTNATITTKNQCDHHAKQVVALVNTFKLQQTQDEPNDEQVHNYNNHQDKHDKEG